MGSASEELAKLGVQSDLLFLWGDHYVEEPVQVQLAKAGLKTVQRFAGLEDERKEAKVTFAEALGYDKSALSVEHKNNLSDVLTAWEVARKLLTLETESKAQAKIAGLTRPVGTRGYQNMKTSFEQAFENLPPP